MHKESIGNEHQNKPVGNFKSYSKIGSGVEIETDHGTIRIMIYREDIFRIRINNGPFRNDFSYAVVAEPMDVSFEVSEDESSIDITTSVIHLTISKNPVRFTFFNMVGKVINEDDPYFGTSWIGSEVTTYKKLQPEERFIGLGEKTGKLDRRGSAYLNWNYDYFGYPANADPLYLTTPIYYGIHSGLSYGIFFDNSHTSVFNFGAANDRFSYFSAKEGEMDYYFIHNENMAKNIEAYTHLTGRMPLPPKWSIGFQQCRYSYYPDKELLNAARTFREKQIPADVLYLDIHYMQDFKAFTWNNKKFPDPAGMMKKLQEMGFHLVLIVDPGIKIEEGYKYYEEGLENEYFAKYMDGEPYSGKVWPGWCHFPDYTKSEAREWWGKNYELYTKDGIDGFWNDMNEPAVWGKRLPDVIKFDYEGEGASFRKVHNLYGMQMARSTYEGVKTLLKGKRPFVLSRAGYAGVQRFAAIWTGDNISTDEHMLTGVRMVNSMGISGIPFAGNDVGGFADEATPALFARWIAIGALSPFFRSHSMINSRDSEPWSFGEEVEEIAKNYINLRYKLIPYLYSVFYEASKTGMPVTRTLAIDYTHDPHIYQTQFQNEYLFGPFILVAPIISTLTLDKVYLPEGRWFDFYTDEVLNGGRIVYEEAKKDKLPVMIKAGAIIPMQSVVQCMGSQPEEVLQVHIYYSNNNSSFEYYEDDGETYEHEAGAYQKRSIELLSQEKKIVFHRPEGNYRSYFKRIRIYFHGFYELHRHVYVNEQQVDVTIEDFKFLEPISDFDPWHYEPDLSKVIFDLPAVEFDNTEDEIVIGW